MGLGLCAMLAHMWLEIPTTKVGANLKTGCNPEGRLKVSL